MVDYDKIKAVNFSSLKHMEKGPLHYQYWFNQPFKQTAAMALGTAVHCMVLEPEQFYSRYAIIDLSRNSKAYKEQAALEAEAGRVILKSNELEQVKLIAAGVSRNMAAVELLQDTERELTLTWEQDGIKRKGRLDAYKPGFVIDLKTCADPQPWAFNAQIAKMFYHAQMAFYAEGAATIYGGEFPAVFIIAVQNKEPYECIVHQLPVPVLARGEEIYTRWIDELVQCHKQGQFPSRYEEVQEVALPGWATADEDVDFSGLEMEE